ncbi:MAG: 30S ribosomal protein S6 [Desulfobulbaceae bacterium]|uniref:Small ribosomal subunit protein bS6 n=1 Tax=Candidatus Desulfobia pelagia TaxID=2841692 RepID=A0A8J6TAM3_9BACT|nr:30S ribosomal protein S6 [Candidatus Desulfobia pelagia]
MRRYETISIIKPALGDEEIGAINQRSISIIEGDGGTILNTDKWGLKTLAYPIKKEQQGYYVYMDFGATPAAVTEMERQFKIDDRILKFMTVKLDDVFDPAAIQAQADAKAKAAEARAQKRRDDDNDSDNDSED